MKRKIIAFLLVLCLAFSVSLANAQNGGRGCAPTTFSSVSTDTFECMKTKLQYYGIYIPPGNFAELSGKGVIATFLWDGKSILTIKVKEKPLLVNCETANNEICKFVEECQGS